MKKNAPPKTEKELLERAMAIAGLTLGELAHSLGITPPSNLKKHKGWAGQLLELVLGATAKSLPEPDFCELGIELKTIPINSSGEPKESTYVCTVQRDAVEPCVNGTIDKYALLATCDIIQY